MQLFCFVEILELVFLGDFIGIEKDIIWIGNKFKFMVQLFFDGGALISADDEVYFRDILEILLQFRKYAEGEFIVEDVDNTVFPIFQRIINKRDYFILGRNQVRHKYMIICFCEY